MRTAPPGERPESTDIQTLGRAGVAALQSGDAAAARQAFEAIVATGRADASVWVALAQACRGLKDEGAAAAALERALALDASNLSALIMKGDQLAAAGRDRAATSFYAAAVTIASGAKSLSPRMSEAVRRAAAERDRINARLEAHLRQRLASSGYDEKQSSRRFTHSLDLLSGRRQLYVQQPRAYYFPELPQVQFYERAMFPWLDVVEAATEDMCVELQRVLATKDAFVPYIEASPDAPRRDHALLNSSDWSAFFLWKDGAPVPQNAARCPRTLAALEGVPLARIKGRMPSIFFSQLKPGARIAPHTGFVNTRLICHLPLVVPPRCGFRVGNDERTWEKGKAWVFDDTIEHEAWNASEETRILLIFDVWRPELSREECELVTALMEAIDAYGEGLGTSWSA